MKPSDVFGIAVRLTGVWLFGWGLWHLISGITLGASLGLPNAQDQEYLPYYFGSGIGGLVWGNILMRNGAWFVRYCYPADVDSRLKSELPEGRGDTSGPSSLS